jgi:hypothetical protein
MRADDARSPQDQKGDPSCAFDALGVAYYAQWGRTLEGARVEIFRSADGERPWTLSATAPINDRPYVIVDTTSSVNRGTMYYVEQANARSVTVAGPNKDGDALKAESFMTGFRVAASNNHRDHFTSQTRFAFGSAYLTDLGRPVLLADGTLVSAFLVRRERGVLQTPGGPAIGWLQTVCQTMAALLSRP